MTSLRQRMITALQLSGKGERTQQSYVREVRLLAQFYGKSPDLISEQELQKRLAKRRRATILNKVTSEPELKRQTLGAG